MPAFQYRAKKPNAENVEGQVFADTKDEAVERIHDLGLIPVSVEETGTYYRKTSVIKRGRVSHREIYTFSQQLVSLLKAGVSIIRALEIVTVQSRNPYFQMILESIRLGIKGGKTFSNCLYEHSDIFSNLYVTLVRAGEESGQLNQTIASVASHLKSQNEFSSKVKNAMMYPLFMLMFGIGTVIFILTFVMPQITTLFKTLGQDLPLPTVIVMAASDFLTTQWGWILAVGIVFIMAWRQFMDTEKGKLFVSQVKLSTPLLRDFWLKVEVAQFCKTLSLLLKSGITIIKAISLSIPVVDNKLLQNEFNLCQQDLMAGKSLGVSLKRSKLIPDLLGHLVVVGEESGALNQTLEEIAEGYEDDTEEVIKVLTTLLEPLMIVFVGSIIGFIVVSMLLPIFQLDVVSR